MIDTSELVLKLRGTGATRIALQFPEGLKRNASGVASALRDAGFFVVISGDPCYGACDLATGLLEIVDLVVHFGHSPLDDTPYIIYDPYLMDFDTDVLGLAIPHLVSKDIGLVTTVQHAHLVPAMVTFMASREITCHSVDGGVRAPNPGQVLGCSYGAARNCNKSEILFVGTGQFHPLGVQLATGARVVALDPYCQTVEVVSSERFLRRRFGLIEVAKKAENFGIILSLKSGQQRRQLAEHLAAMRKSAVIVALREVSPDELLNLGFSCYVNTACPRLAYDDQDRFPVPVISPQEFEIVCGSRSFEDYQIDEIT
ncbi:MAG: diphthamide biosynthesis enzyme Dph2 [Methanomicrobiales archaeon]